MVFRLLPRQRSLQLFEELDPPEQLALIESLEKDDAQALLEDLDPSKAGGVLRGLPKAVRSKLSGIMKKSGYESAKRVMDFAPETVGALMRSRFVPLRPQWTVHQALERIQLSTRLRRIEETHLDTLPITDDMGHLVGNVGLKELVVAPRHMSVHELMDENPRTLRPEADQEEAVNLFTRYRLKSAPVVSDAGEILGVVVYKDIFKIASAETEEDFAKMAGTRPGLLSESAYSIAKVRLPWLVATCLGELAVSAIIKHYEFTLERVVALATFIPLIAAMGGNVGAQTATVVVRGLATGEVRKGEEAQVVFKEVAVGMMIGLVYGILIGLSAFVFYGNRYGPRFAFVVGFGMFVSMTAAATGGSIEPLIFRRLGIDPATATGPLITTFTDLLSTSVYFFLAARLLL